MKIKSIQMKNFRRFTDLTIEQLPKAARLVVMIGPNGSGKSSVFDALLKVRNTKGKLHNVIPDDYYVKFGASKADYRDPKIKFHRETELTREEWRKAVHMRSSYRNDLIDSTDKLATQAQPLTDVTRFRRLSDNDQSVGSNYGRILSLLLEYSSAEERRNEKLGDIQDEIYGELIIAIEELFTAPQLELTGLGSPKDRKVFQFDKGTSHGFTYHNLSGGEKAALDLILDVIVAKAEFNDTVFCIDEPEAHIHTKLQGPLLEQLYKLIPCNSQLWIATHSVGMVRKAQDLWRKDPDSVIFLDFDNKDFDKQVPLIPTIPNPNFWARTYEVALGDLAKLIAPKQIVLCESTEFDADCYNKIFGVHYPDTRFVSIGNCEDVEKADENLIPVIEAITGGAETLRLRDRDEADDIEIEENKEKGIRTLSRRNIEGYLLDNEVLAKFCEDHNIPHKHQDLINARQAALKDSIARGKPSDDLKPTAQRIHGAAKNALQSRKIGNKSRGFMKNILAPCIQPGMVVYEQLHNDIFGE